MSKPTETDTKKQVGDIVLQEMWQIKDTLSASYNHDVKRLFEETRQREKLSEHRLVDPPKHSKH